MTSLYLPEHQRIILRPGAKVGKGGNPHHYLVDGEKYQRVTTILEKTVPKPGLVYWAKDVGIEKMARLVHENWSDLTRWGYDGRDAQTFLNGLIDQAKAEPDRVKDAAADWGTEVHGYIQQDIEAEIQGNNRQAVVPDVFRASLIAFHYLEAKLDITWWATEMVVWSDTLRVAGTVDAVGQLPDGSWILMDWKTGEYRPEKKGKDYHGGFFWPAENALQLAAYASMFTEVTGHPVASAWIVRYPRNAPEPVPCAETHPETGHLIGGGIYNDPPCRHCDGSGVVAPPGFSARQVADLGSAALHFDMLVDHARWLAQSPWVKET